ncbi:MAG TPA: 4Fe-4S binding protein [Candidatus Gastranaerophilaceae bacterium]|nr:4Fe-4S binding protein [Candidatus Gastranaerophilaceae bacterium]HPT41050.1 4Fe-4S binding protein [Candidatus Gastranaerophilaceae bacterium]
MKRDIIKIDEKKCNGCGNCIPGCPEGALQIIDGKARLVSDLFCDGLGACIGNCPAGAMKIEQREAEAYDEYKAMKNIIKGGENVIKAHLKHLDEHGELGYLSQAIDFLEQKNIPVPDYKGRTQCNCPSTMSKKIDRENFPEKTINLTPQLNNWPIQLALMNPDAQYFENADLLISADCVPFSYPNFHQKFLKDKVLIMFCPKLDKTLEQYIEKLTYIFKNKNIQSVSIVHMEVPCCSGVEIIIKKALEKAQKIITIKDYTISISGEIV